MADAMLVRFERSAFAVVTALAVAIVFALPVIPGHDVPQHLAYVRLVATWQVDPGALPDVYTLPDVSNVYATMYRLLALLSCRTSPETALRLSLVLYVVLLALAVRWLVRATWRSESGSKHEAPPMTSLLGPLVAFNPVLCMGLLAYVFALAPFVGACAAAIDFIGGGRRRHLVASGVLAAVTAALHGVASAALLFYLGILLAFRRDRRTLAAFGAALAGVAFTSRVLGAAARFPVELGEGLLHNMRVYGIVPGFLGTFRVSFTHWLQKLEQVVASLFGPFPHAEKVLCALLVAGVVGFVVHARRREAAPVGPEARSVSGVRGAVLVFALAAVLAPAAIQVPDDLSLIDFRLITTVTILGVAAIPPNTLTRARSPRWALATATAMALLVWARQLSGTAGEVMQTVRLTEHLGPGDRLLALPMHDASAFLDPRNAVLHYSAVHHTARTTGVTSLFWGRFSPRLPVGYQPGREPPHPFDWAPWELTDEQLQAFSHVIVRWPGPHDEERLRELGAHVTRLSEQGVLQTVACDGDCCLFQVVGAKLARRAAATAAPSGR